MAKYDAAFVKVMDEMIANSKKIQQEQRDGLPVRRKSYKLKKKTTDDQRGFSDPCSDS